MCLCPWGVAAHGAELSAETREFFARYCLDCHGDDKQKGDFDLRPLLSAALSEDPWAWQEVRDQIESEEMPPEEPLPEAAQRRAVLEWIDSGLAGVDWTALRRPGRVTMARLTRSEYRHTMRDLLGVDLHAGESLSAEGEGASGFENDRDALALTPALLDLYFDEAERLVDAVSALKNEPQRQHFSAQQMARLAGHDKRFEEGAMLVHPDQRIQSEVAFPVDGWFRFEFVARNFGKPSVIEVAIGEQVVATARVVAEQRAKVVAVGFVRAGQHRVSVRSKNLVPQTPLPGDVTERVQQLAGQRAARLDKMSDSESEAQRAARLALNERAVAIQEAYEWLRMLGPDGDPREVDRFRKYALERDHGSGAMRDQLAKVSGLSRAGLDALWEKHNAGVLAENRRLLEAVAHVQWQDWQWYQGKIVVDSMAVVGPVEDGGAAPVEFSDADGALSREFVERAFRRPVPAPEWQRYDAIRRQATARGESQDAALRLAAASVLVSPEFLLHRRQTRLVDESKWPMLDDFSLASRLSYFLWQSMPDERLIELAQAGRLGNVEVLRAEVTRMLADEKAEAFFAAFTEQWLGLSALRRGVGADRNRYPEFTPELAAAMCDEATLWFRQVVRGDEDLLRLIDARQTFVNGVLAKHYGIVGLQSEAWQKVELRDRNRGGVLGMAAVLTATSAPTRAHPSRRGTWVLETLLGRQQGEPLADAGELPGDAGETRGRTLREEMELHSNRAECAVCHDKIDPVGLGLQSFDALGRWRDLEAGAVIDDRGRLPDGEMFDGPAELKQALVERRPEVLRHLSAGMLAFALGRDLEPFDTAEIERIAETVEARGGSAHALLEAVVTSLPFRFSE